MKNSIPDNSHIPDLLLERFRLGEMSPAEIKEIRRRLEVDEELRSRLRALEESDEEIRRRYPSSWLAMRIRERADSHAKSPLSTRQPRFSWRLPLAAAVAMVVIALGWRVFAPLYQQPDWQVFDSGETGDRIKGDSLVLFRKTADGSETLFDGASARAGDQIRIGYRAAGAVYGVILSIDGRGVVTLHYPLDGDVAAPLQTEGLALLDHAYELDDAPNWERFYLVSGPEVFDIDPVLEAARRSVAAGLSEPTDALQLPFSLNQSSLTLRKEANP